MMGVFKPTFFGSSNIVKKKALIDFSRSEKSEPQSAKPQQRQGSVKGSQPILTKKQVAVIKKKRKKILARLKRGLKKRTIPFRIRL